MNEEAILPIMETYRYRFLKNSKEWYSIALSRLPNKITLYLKLVFPYTQNKIGQTSIQPWSYETFTEQVCLGLSGILKYLVLQGTRVVGSKSSSSFLFLMKRVLCNHHRWKSYTG